MGRVLGKNNLVTEMGLEQPGPVGGVPACGRGLEQDHLHGHFQPKPFCGSVKLWSQILGTKRSFEFPAFSRLWAVGVGSPLLN